VRTSDEAHKKFEIRALAGLWDACLRAAEPASDMLLRVTPPAPSAGTAAAPEPTTGRAALVLVWLASGLVLAACTLAGFRLGFAEDPATLARVNGPRVLFAAAAGAALALAGALRLAAGSLRPLFELELLAAAVGAAGGGFLAASGRTGAAGLIAFGVGALAGGALLGGLARALDRPRRWTNLAAAVLLAALAAVAALAGTYARARRDAVSSAIAWLLGDLTGASFASGSALFALAIGLLILALSWLRSGAHSRLASLSWLAFGLGAGAAGPLAFIGSFAPCIVAWLARGASPAALLPASAAAGAAGAAAIDSVPRLLVGGYDFPFALPAAMLAIPIFLGWNRQRLRRLAGPASLGFEILEVVLIAGMTLVGALLAGLLARVIAVAT
jgi:ABC-type Fe3+-siderophore transport system permease subunit